MTDEFLETLGIIIRDQMIMKNSVQINGLGTFNPVHKNQVQEKMQKDETSCFRLKT